MRGARLKELRLLDRRVEFGALLRKPCPLGRDGGVFGRASRRGAEPLEPGVHIGEARLEIGELVANVVAQRRDALRQLGQAVHAKTATPRARLDLVERRADRLDADQRRLLCECGWPEREQYREDEGYSLHHGRESEHGGPS